MTKGDVMKTFAYPYSIILKSTGQDGAEGTKNEALLEL